MHTTPITISIIDTLYNSRLSTQPQRIDSGVILLRWVSWNEQKICFHRRLYPKSVHTPKVMNIPPKIQKRTDGGIGIILKIATDNGKYLCKYARVFILFSVFPWLLISLTSLSLVS